MDIDDILASEQPESPTLEYKSSEAHPDGILKEIVALANNEGGQIIVGVKENDGEIEGIEDIPKTDAAGLEEYLQNQLGSKVEPRLDVDFNLNKYDGKRIIEISVPSRDLLRSLDDGKPVFPIRQGSTTTYLHGLNLAQAYSGQGPDLTPLTSESTSTDPDTDPQELLRKASSERIQDRALLLLYYAETYEQQEGITTDELGDLFERARVPTPRRLGIAVRDLENGGHIMAVGDNPASWRLTLKGIENAEALINEDEDLKSKKSRSLSEHYRQADNPTKRDAALIVGWYLEYQEGQSDFTKPEVEERATDAKIRLGANVSRDLSNQVRDGNLAKVDERDGQDAYHLTLTGEEYVEETLL